jgi:hypothetical protein
MLRLGTFLCGGVLLGIIVGVIGVLLITGYQEEISLSEQIGIIAFLMVTCIGIEFIFGVALILVNVIRKGLEMIWRKLKEVQERRDLPAPA